MATYWENSCSFGLRFVSWYMYLIVSLVFSHLGFWSGNLFLIAPFPDLCLLVPFLYVPKIEMQQFGSKEGVVAAVNEYLEDQQKDFYLEGIGKLEQRWTKCIALKGDYIEK